MKMNGYLPSRSNQAVVLAAWLLLCLSSTVVTADAFASSSSAQFQSQVVPLGQRRHDTNNNIGIPRSFTKKKASALILKSEDADDNNDGVTNNDIPRGGAFIGGGENSLAKTPPALPTLSAYRKFALPCLALWVAGPLLSLVDTAFVGLSGDASASAQQLAALGPATTFFDGATYLFAFLNVATTNLYSSARAQAGEQSDKAENVVRTAARVSLNCGLGLMAFLLLFSRPLLSLYIGHEAGASTAIIDAAVEYVNIRAFSMPTSLLLGVVQAACLGAKDSVTPLIAILWATAVNISGDFLLVKQFGMGLKGAALATLFAQWASTIALLGPARRRLIRNHSFELFEKGKKGDGSARTFLAFALPVLTLILGKLAAFGFMTHSAAALPDQPTALASHQIILSLFFFVSPFMEVISQTAQTFLPPFLAPVTDYIEKKRQKDVNYDPSMDPVPQAWKKSSFTCATQLLKIGFMSAVTVASIASLVPAFFGNMLTQDLVVQEAIKPLAKLLWIGAFLTGPVAVSEGVLLARRELRYLATIYLVSTAVLPSALLRIKTMKGSISQIWACFGAFQLFRAACFAGKIWLVPALARIGQVFGRGTEEGHSSTDKA